MITDFIGEFMFHPAPLEFSGNYCSHNCCYCFANIRKSCRVINLKGIIKQINKKEVKTYQDALIKEGYPICMSNKSDPFSDSNIAATIALGYELTKLPNGIFIQTKGGKGIDEFLKAINYKKNIVWYITITTLNEDIRKRIEPNAPTTQDRFELAKKLKDLGYLVILAINPILEKWMPLNDLEKFMLMAKELNIRHIVTEALHLNKHEVSKFTEKRKNSFEADEIEYALPKKSFQNYVKKVIPILIKNNFHVMKLGMPYYTEFFYDIRKEYKHIFPNQYDIINWCYNNYNKKIVTFDEFYEHTVDNKVFFERKFKYVNKYLLKANIHEWAASKEAKNIFSLKEVLNFIWNNSKIKSSLSRNQSFRIVSDENFNPIKDKNNNIQLYFDKGIYPTQRIININDCKNEKLQK